MRRALLVGALCLALAGCGATTSTEPPAAVARATAPADPHVADPVRVLIPKLGVDDDVLPVGKCAKVSPPACPDGAGEMELPPVEHTGWYRPGPEPGEPGTAVLAGHVNWEGQAGALGRIGELATGDLVTVVDATGIERTFVVYAVVQIPKAKYPEQIKPLLSGRSGGPELRLVTCSGEVVGREYLDNTIVSARPLDEVSS
jgi:hypothetical protein